MLKSLKIMIIFALSALVLSTASAQRESKAETDLKLVSESSLAIKFCEPEPISSLKLSQCKTTLYPRLSAADKGRLDPVIEFLANQNAAEKPTCHVHGGADSWGWTCANGGTMCTCVHNQSGPTCVCSKIDD